MATTGTVVFAKGRDVQVYQGSLPWTGGSPVWTVALLDSTWTIDPTNQQDWTVLAPYEVSNSGYAQKVLTGLSMNVLATTPVIRFDLLADDPVWTATGTWSDIPYGFAVYDATTGKVALLGETRSEDRHTIASTETYTIDLQASTAVPGVITADPLADAATQLLLQRVIDLGSRTTLRCMSGLHYASSSESSPGSAGATSMTYIASQSGGRKPLILGIEYSIGASGSKTGPTLAKLKSLNAVMRPLIDVGHVVKIWNHHPNPNPAGTGGYDYDPATNTCDFDDIVTPGTPTNDNWQAYLDIQAAALIDLARPVLYCVGKEANAADLWFGVQNPDVGPKSGGDIAKWIAWYVYTIEGLWSRGAHNILPVYHMHEYDPQGYDVAVGTPGRTWPTQSYFGSGITGWEAMFPPTGVDFTSLSVYNKTWAGKRDNCIEFYERTDPSKPSMLGEVGPGNSTPIPGWDVGAVLLPELQATYVPANPASGLSFEVGWMHWRDSNNDPTKQAGWSTIMNDPITCNLGDL